MAGFEGIRPNLVLDSPRREKLLQASRLNVPQHIVCPPDVIHTVPWRALLYGAPGHRAPPQLAQFQMMCRHISVHITLNQFPTGGTIPLPGIMESFVGRSTHIIQVLLERHHIPEHRHWLL